MLDRAEKVTTGAVVAEGLVTAGTVVPRGRVAAGAVETAEVAGAKGCAAARAVGTAEAAGARGCVATRAVETAEVDEARSCVAARVVETAGAPEPGAAGQRGRQKSRGWPKPAAGQRERQKSRGWPKPRAAGQRERQKSRGWSKPGAAGQREREAVAESVHITGRGICDGYVWLPRWPRFWASREPRRASYSLGVSAVSQIPARVAAEEESKAAAFVRSGRISRSCSAVAKSSACWSAVVRACSIPSFTSRRETNTILACISGLRLSQTGARYRRGGGGP